MQLTHIHTEADLEAGLAALAAADRRFADLIAAAGRPPLRRRPGGYAGLAAIIVSQQLSTASAAAIWGRLAAAFDDPLDPAAILRARPARLARLGLSSPKIRALKAIARAVIGGELALAALANGAAEDAHAALTAIHGIGPWTADIYLLACLGHADAWPAGDLALQEAVRVAFALPLRPSAKEMLALAAPWRPWRAIAARVLWSYYRTATAKPADRGGAVSPAKAGKGTARVIAPPKRRASAGGSRRRTRSGRVPARGR